ncbi:MAG: [protein-PII] uridylyltransferase [Candidatus Rokubacteria bacterium]|nr:[protein-PII] uridylyltransferase [Candidatus Rokubacteria bacterium]
MAAELFRQLRRAETELERSFLGSAAELADRRRRVRLDLLRQHLAAGYDSLKARHAEGASGQESVQAHAGFIDEFLRQLFRLALDDCRRQGLDPSPLVLVALGGYGRGELHPSSDIDLMVIYADEMTPSVQRITQEILYTLWDLGLQLGHSCRSLGDCLAMARTDFPSRTAMQDARYLAGDRRLFRRFRRVLNENLYRKDFPAFVETTLAERDQRYRKYGASPYIGEPNVKESAGGLRDIHTAMWLASSKFGARTLQELADKGLITGRERQAADAALTFLWRVRNELHFLSAHKNDALTRDVQAQIAKNFGYTDDDVSLGVEKFMREYYLHARVIHRVSERLIARCQETLSRRGAAARRLRQEALADGLVVFDGRLHLADGGSPAFRQDPIRLLRVFWHMHRTGAELSIDLERAIEDSLDLVDDAFRRSSDARDLLLAICRNWGRAAQTLSAMHELGLLGGYLPEFGALTCLVQYDVYHKFTADQHSLLAVEHLESLAPGQSEESEGVAQVLPEVEKPEILLLGVLLHDIGKARGHGHVAKGVPLIKALALRLGLEREDAATLVFLAEHHLLMSHVAQRRDIDDPKTIESLVAAVQTPERLRMLYLLTLADMRAVGPGVLTQWRASILWELYRRALAHLSGGAPERPSQEAVAARVVEELGEEGSRARVERHLLAMAERYRWTTGAQRIAAHLRLIEQLEEAAAATELFHHAELGFSDLVVVTRDLPGLFSLIAGTLAANGINILSAQIHTRADGIAIDTFQVNDSFGEAVTAEARWARILGDLRRVIRGETAVEALLAERGPRRRGEAEPIPGPGKVVLDNHLSDTHTVVEVKCLDRVGLLYLITRTLSREGLDISSARIATEIDHAFDVFYTTDRHGRKVEEPAALAQIREALEAALVTAL